MPTTPESDLIILKRRAKVLAVLAMQSDRASTDLEFRDAITDVLEVTQDVNLVRD